MLEAEAQVTSIELVAPNIHHIAADLAPFGLDNPGEVFHVTDRPYGLIEVTVERDDALMEFLSPTSLSDALAARAEHPGSVPIMGGTDVMVELNFDRHRPEQLLDLTRVPELATWERVNGEIRLGAAVSYTRVINELGRELPGLAMASRTVGSPQIRNRGSVGGNLGAASPAGDAHPALLAAFAEVELSSTRGVRRVPANEFYAGVKRHVGRPDELITAIWIRPASGPQQFSKIGTRNAMVIAVAAFGLALHPERQLVGDRHRVGRPDPAPREPTPRRSSQRSWTGLARADVPRRGGRRVRPAGRGRRIAHRRRPRYRGVPPALALGDGPALPGVGLDRIPARRRPMRVTITVNGERRQVDDVWEGESLLYVLRERMGLPGLEERLRAGRVRVVHGLSRRGDLLCLSRRGRSGGRARGGHGGRARRLERELHPVQQAFVDAGAVQCGFCTPGLLVATHDLLARDPDPDDSEIREALAGNLCRCTGYEKIIDAVHLAAGDLDSICSQSGCPDDAGDRRLRGGHHGR